MTPPVPATVRSLAGQLSSGGFAAGWHGVRLLPEPVATRLFTAAADLAARRGGAGTERLRRNLERVAPGEDLLRAAMRSYARYWCEAFRLPSISAERLIGGTQTSGEQHLRDAVASGRGTVLALPHSGNWDAAGAWLAATGVPFATVAERLKPESLYERFVAFREGLGMEVLPLTGGDRPPFDVLRERLSAGGAVCLLADRDLTPRGVDVTFFGAAARMPAGPARLAQETGADLIPCALSFTDGGWAIAFDEPVPHADVATMTQQLATAFERGIARHPQDWHMLQLLWLDDLPDGDPRKQPLP
ncbi:MAG: putative 1-acylglycerol-3-phosphate O-acyltransferase [Frankiales bacterium]|nr:putative 1-acylglycerol-3-phosphate O-acyltransferase [Frankiales bacterium]